MIPIPRVFKDGAKGALALQPLFERLHRISLTGMNYGRGGDLETSGELHILRWLHDRYKQEALDRPFTVFDVGANVGDYSNAVLALFGDDAVIHAFEPTAASYASLTRRFGRDRRVRLNNLAVGREDGTLRVYSEGPESRIASAYSQTLGDWGIENMTEEIAIMRSLASYCADANIPTIDLLKIDVEGHELPVLEGALPLIQSRSIRSIQWEFGNCHVAARTFLRDFFSQLGADYRVYRVVRDGLRPVRYSTLLEVFWTANFFADLRDVQAVTRD